MNSFASSMLRQSGGNRRIVLVPATPVNTFSSNSNLLRTSLIDSSNSIPIIRPRPRISLIPGLAERCAAFAWKGCKLAAVGDFETITFEDDPTRQPGFLIKATEVEFLSPRKVEEEPQTMDQPDVCEAA